MFCYHCHSSLSTAGANQCRSCMCWIALGLIILSWSNHQNSIKQVPSCEENFIIYQLRSGVLCGAVTGSRWTTRMQARTTKIGQRIKKYSSRAAIGSEVLIRILSHLLSNVTASLWFSEPCLLPYFWTVNLLQDLSSQYRIFWTHSSHENYSPLTSAVRCWSGPWAICSSRVICDNIMSPLKSC